MRDYIIWSDAEKKAVRMVNMGFFSLFNWTQLNPEEKKWGLY